MLTVKDWAVTDCPYTNDMKKLLFFLILLVIFLTPGLTLGMCVEGDCENGRGTLTLSSGTQYVGEFKDGRFNGHGRLTYPDGKIYIGTYKEGKKHGQGTMAHPDGEEYTGEWKDGKWNYTAGVEVRTAG